jgi:hypothetical protein
MQLDHGKDQDEEFVITHRVVKRGLFALVFCAVGFFVVVQVLNFVGPRLLALALPDQVQAGQVTNNTQPPAPSAGLK